MKPKNILFIIMGVLFLTVLLQNTQVVTLRFLLWEISMSQIILLPIVVVLGIVIGFFIGKKSWDW